MTIRAPRRERAATYKTAADLAFKTEGGSEWCLVQLIRNIGDSALAGDLDAAKWLAEKLTKAAEMWTLRGSSCRMDRRRSGSRR